MCSVLVLWSWYHITEYTIHDRELQETRKKLSEMENKRKNSGEEAERLRNDLQDAQDNAKTAQKEVKDLKVKESGAKEERDVLNTDVQSQTKDKTRYVWLCCKVSCKLLGFLLIYIIWKGMNFVKWTCKGHDTVVSLSAGDEA